MSYTRLTLGVGLAWLSVGCAGSGAAAGSAAVNSAAALAVSAAERSQGRCYATCPVGTSCDPRTGLCQPLPCRGRCGPGTKCVQTGAIERCAPEQEPDLTIQREGTNQPKAPSDIPTRD